MKKTKEPEGVISQSDALKSEYAFDYKKSRPNRFAGQIDHQRLVVSLDADVAEVFKSSQAVNTVLRAMISAMRDVSSSSLTSD